MKLFRNLILFCAICAGVSLSANAAILIGSLTTVTTATTNTATFQTNYAYIQLPQITVVHNGISATNSFQGSFRWSVDNVNFYTNSSPQFFPSATNNLASDTISAQTVTVPIYVQMLATTNSANTGTIQLGVTSP